MSSRRSSGITARGRLTPVLKEKGNPLWVGRAQRTVNPKLRLALNLRDGGCSMPGCDRHPDWTQGHHDEPWSEGGTTDLDNTTLQCSIDHKVADAGYVWVPLPDGRLAKVRRGDGPAFGPALDEPGGRGP